jgi:hypothetical protein
MIANLMFLNRTAKILLWMTLGLPLFSASNTPLQGRAFTCEQVMSFDGRTGKLAGDWSRQLDNLAEFHAFEKATGFTATFYVARYEEYVDEFRKAQRRQVGDVLRAKNIPHQRIEFEVPDPHSHVYRSSSLSPPYLVVVARYTFNQGDTRMPPKCL